MLMKTMPWRIPAVILASLLLSACVHTQTTAVRPVDTVMDQAALQAGELRIAASALQGGDVNVAKTLYTELSQNYPEMPAVWQGLGDAHAMAAEYEAARRAYNKSLALEPGNLDTKLALARVDVRTRNLEQARTSYEQILAQHPNDPVALSGLGVVYDLSGQASLAQETYRRGLEANPGSELLRTNLGLSLALNGHARQAVNILIGNDGASDSLPQRRDNLALAYGILGREDAAESILATYQSSGQVQDNLEFYRFLRTRIK